MEPIVGDEVYVKFKRQMSGVWNEFNMRYRLGGPAGIVGVYGKIVRESPTHFYLATQPKKMKEETEEPQVVGHEICKTQIEQIWRA